MQPNRLEFQKQCAFQSFCKRALRNEAANAHKELKRRRAKEVSFSDLTPQEQDQLCTYDSYFYGGHEDTEPGYYAAGKKITAKLIRVTRIIAWTVNNDTAKRVERSQRTPFVPLWTSWASRSPMRPVLSPRTRAREGTLFGQNV